MIDVPPETPHQPRGRDHVAVENGKRTDDEHPAWCSPAHCFVTDEEVRVHQQAPTRWEDQTAELCCESGLLDPADDEYVYVELSLRISGSRASSTTAACRSMWRGGCATSSPSTWTPCSERRAGLVHGD